MIIFLLGAPGAGKGTLAKALVQQKKIIHISTGDLFRNLRQSSTPFAKKVKKIMDAGILISDEITNKILAKELTRYNLAKVNILLDGYPRNINQLKFLNKIKKVNYAIDLFVPQNVLLKRLTGRRNCPNCQAIYNIYFKKPKMAGICDKCHTELIQRKDDNKQAVKVRFAQYKKLNAPLVKVCQKAKIYHKINNIDLSQSLSQIIRICHL